MKKVYFLKTCSTCSRILKEFDLTDWDLHELKEKPVTPSELDEMFRLTNSYEALFNKRSMQIKHLNLDLKSLKEEDFKKLILSHYSFLKRPVFITDNHIFVGNAKKTVAELHQFFDENK